MYLPGGKYLQFPTDHKPLLLLFNNPQAKLPPRIKRLIVKMQNLDFTMIHIHGKENVTDNMPRDARERKDWSRETRESSDSSQADHAVMLEKIATETEQNAELQHLN
jgi:hypothetical protein